MSGVGPLQAANARPGRSAARQATSAGLAK
jgi:hypothetical protein